MKPSNIKRLFGLKTGCALVAFDGFRNIEVAHGGFQELLTQYYLSSPWKYFHIRLPSGAHYPNDYIKA